MTRRNVLGELAELEQLSTPRLKEKWRALLGTDPPAYSKKGLFRRLASVVQRLHYGGLTKVVVDQLDRVLVESGIDPDDSSTFVAGPRKPYTGRVRNPIGSRFTVEYKGTTYTLTFLQKGVDVNGQLYTSPTKAATEITGSHRNGFRFFKIQ